jgi:hypothetical protein
MTNKIIDCALSVAAFPATYTGPGTLIGNVQSSAGSLNQLMTGNFTSTGDAVEIWCGITPRVIEIINETDGIYWKKVVGMAAANALKFNETGPVISVDTNGYITVEQTSNGYIILLSASLVGTGKNIVFSLHD